MKITQVEPVEPTEEKAIAQSEPIANPTPTPDLITAVLSVGIATFRMPTAIDLHLTEKAVGGVQDSDFSIDFYRQLATNTCLSYGGAKALPEDSSLIKAKDDNKIVLTFIEKFREASIGAKLKKDSDDQDLTDYAVLQPDGSTKSGFDSVEVTLTNGDKVCLDEPSARENQMRENSSTAIEGILIVASALCRSWGGESLSIAEYRLKLNRLSVYDFFRVSNALTFFR